MIFTWRPFGSEQACLQSSFFHKVLWKIRGDFHIGRWLRYFYVRKSIEDFNMMPASALDVGCGKGQTSFFLKRRFPRMNCEGVDISRQDIDSCEVVNQFRGAGIKFICADLQAKPVDRAYDLIIMNNVLCEIQDYKKMLSWLAEKLPPKGWLVIQDMNSSGQKKRDEPFPYEGARHWGFSLAELGTVLEQNHVRVMRSQQTFGFWGKLAHNLFDYLRGRTLLLNLLFPLLLFIGYLDTGFPGNPGDGLWIVGQKEKGLL